VANNVGGLRRTLSQNSSKRLISSAVIHSRFLSSKHPFATPVGPPPAYPHRLGGDRRNGANLMKPECFVLLWNNTPRGVALPDFTSGRRRIIGTGVLRKLLSFCQD